ncbi:MAG: hypothetical protein OHK006_23660 [Thermodesulfovibrionales bacterium]
MKEVRDSKEIKEIIDLGRKLDELTAEVYHHFSQREDFSPRLVALWTDLAAWKKTHAKLWRKISKTYVYRNILKRRPEDLQLTIRQLKNIQSELVEFLRRLRKKRIPQEEAVSQTVLNEFCLVSDIFLEIFHAYDETETNGPGTVIETCQTNIMRMADTLRPYLKLNPLYAALVKSILEMRHKHEVLLHRQGTIKKKAAG